MHYAIAPLYERYQVRGDLLSYTLVFGLNLCEIPNKQNRYYDYGQTAVENAHSYGTTCGIVMDGLIEDNLGQLEQQNQKLFSSYFQDINVGVVRLLLEMFTVAKRKDLLLSIFLVAYWVIYDKIY